MSVRTGATSSPCKLSRTRIGAERVVPSVHMPNPSLRRVLPEAEVFSEEKPPRLAAYRQGLSEAQDKPPRTRYANHPPKTASVGARKVVYRPCTHLLRPPRRAPHGNGTTSRRVGAPARPGGSVSGLAARPREGNGVGARHGGTQLTSIPRPTSVRADALLGCGASCFRARRLEE